MVPFETGSRSPAMNREFTIYTVLMLAIGAATAFFITARLDHIGLVAVESDWEYRWSVEDPWEPIAYPSNPPGRESRTRVWYRMMLPELRFDDPALFIYAIDLNARIFVDGREIYRFGDPDAGEYLGWPWHLVSLDREDAGQYLEIEVYSDYRDIGLFGDILLGEYGDQIRRIYDRDASRFLVWSVSIVLALIFLGIYFAVPTIRAFLYLAIVTLNLSVRVVSMALVAKYIFDAPLFWEYLRVASYVAMPLTVALSIGEIVDGVLRRIARTAAFVFAVALVVAVGAPLGGLIRITAVYGGIDLVVLLSLLVLGGVTVRAGISGNAEASFITVNFAIIGAFGLYSMLMFNGLVPWSNEIDYLMLFQLCAGLLYVLVRRFVLSHRSLQSANSELERRVAERTRELETANERLEQEKQHLKRLSITDGLTGLCNRSHVVDRLRALVSESKRYSRPLSIIIYDLDYFKRINDEFGHPAGDRVLIEVARALSASLRDSDVCGRYGGEEFLVLLPETGLDEAIAVAERIRATVEALRCDGPPEIVVTISGGVATCGDESYESLLRRADTLLYEAKTAGRNRIVR